MLASLPSARPHLTAPRCAVSRPGGGVKSARRLLNSLDAAPNGAAAEALVKKFVAGSSKSTSLGALSFLLSISSPFAIPVYSRMSKTNWFNWNSKTTASIVTLLELQNESIQAEMLITDSISRLKSSSKDLSIFYSNLIESLCHHGLTQQAVEVYTKLQLIPLSGRRNFELAIKSLCLMGNPTEAESKLKEMILLGYHPSRFEFASVAQSYGKLGSFSEVKRVIGLMEESGLEIDTVCANVVLSCYADHEELAQMAEWLRRMRELCIGFSLRTYNTSLNSCRNILQIINEIDSESLPLSLAGLIEKLENDCASCQNEANVLKELVNSSVLAETLHWSESQMKLDLHGFRAVSAYVILLQWIEEMRSRFGIEGTALPGEIEVVCGMGKHSVSGKSTVRSLVSKILSRMDSPLRLDRKNVGRFVGRGKAVKDWLSRLG
ncbi:pentatricopeptide (PPR) repeat-containing protein [Carex rostrata]